MKANIVLVVLFVACVIAAVGLPMFAASWSEEIKQALTKQAEGFSDLEAIKKSRFVPPGGGDPVQVVVNQQLVDRYRDVANKLSDDAQQVIAKAHDHNSKEYHTLFPELFGDEVSRAQLETLPQQFFASLQREYHSLLTLLSAGSPPTTESLVETLEATRVRFMDNKLSKREEADLTVEERAQLEGFLSDRRMKLLRANAEEIGIFLDEETLGIPEFDRTKIPNVGTLFTWQWRFWAVADALAAIATANGGQSELTAPVKRLTLVEVIGLPLVDGDTKNPKRDPVQPDIPDQSSQPKKGGGAMGMGGDFSKNRPDKKPDKPPSKDQGQSNNKFGNDDGPVAVHTNRGESPLFDILQVRLTMMVSTSRIPTILDCFAQNNFATIVDIALEPVNKFESLEDGFDYGAEPVSKLTVVLETIWLRAWTVESMPTTIKESLGI